MVEKIGNCKKLQTSGVKVESMPEHAFNEELGSDYYSRLPLPRVVRIEPSSLCNLRCTHCPIGTRQDVNKRGNMTNRVWCKIVEELKSYNNVNVVVLYHGGEPFFNKNIFSMIDTLKSMGIPFVKIVTNGTLIKDEMLPEIIKSGLDSIEFSLDGLSPEENNQIRIGSDYYQVASTIKKLLSLKNNLRANKPDIFIANTQIPTESDIKKNVQVSTPKYLLDDFSDFEGKIGFKNTYMLKWPGFDCFDDYRVVEGPMTKNHKLSNYCNHVMETITFRWNGDVVPCCYDTTSNYVIGNIMEQPLSEIWNNKRYKNLRKSIHLQQYLPLCVNCSVIKPQLFVVKNQGENENAIL